VAIDLAILKADRKAVIADIPTTATSNAQEVVCRRSVMAMTDQATAPGLLADYVFSLHSVTSEWTTLPVVGGLITVAAKDYRVLRVMDDPVGTRFDMGAEFTERNQAR